MSVEITAILEETKKTHENLRTAVEDFKQTKSKMEDLEKKVGHVPADLQEKIAKIDTAVDSFDVKHEELRTQYAAMEAKLNDLEMFESQAADQGESKESIEHAKLFVDFLRNGMEAKSAEAKRIVELQTKSMFAGSDPDGGYAISRPMSNMIQTAKRDATPFRMNADSVGTSTDSFRYMIDIGDASAGWVSERASRSKTSTPQLEEGMIMVHEMYANPAVTQTLLDDAAFNVESWLANKIVEKFGDMESNAFLKGTGVGQPRGILTYAAGTSWKQIEQINSGGATTITADQLITLQDALKEQYAGNAKFYMNRKTVSKVRQLKAHDNQYIWQPGLVAGAPTTLLGDPIEKMNYMPTIEAGSLSVMYGDLKQAYLIVDRFAIRVLRDPYSETPFVLFKTNARVGGDVVNFEAVKLMKTATL
jgi:HK97 family phage major capsid protein